ncbi:MAG: hypothetical protein GC186_10125 [Rhodobacteraceae bacterium]|nr:hypothetical protein [Paracoccaceae bacterium]
MPADSPRGGYAAVGRIADLDTGRRLIVHAAESWHDAVQSGRFDFFVKLAAKARVEAVQPLLVRAERPASQRLLGQRGLHLMLGPRHPVASNVLHVHPGYLWGFWYLDPEGVNYRSSIGQRTFDPAGIDADAAADFVRGLRDRLVAANVSKFPQAARAPLPPPFAAIFVQEIERYGTPVHHLDSETMLRVTAAAAGGAPVLVKLHPAQSAETAARLTTLAASLPGVTITTASLHDIAAAARVIVTQNSAAGFEALLQHRPVITCAISDYHAATQVARTPAELTEALRNAPARLAAFPYDAYLAWFLRQHQFEPTAPDFTTRVWAACLATGAL